MNTNVKNICEVVEDIKKTLTDCQYEFILDNLMKLHQTLNKNKKEQSHEEYIAYMTDLYDRGLIL